MNLVAGNDYPACVLVLSSGLKQEAAARNDSKSLVAGADLRLAPPRLFQPLHPFGDRQNSFHPRLIEHSLGVGICFLDASACAFTKRLRTAGRHPPPIFQMADWFIRSIRMRLASVAGVTRRSMPTRCRERGMALLTSDNGCFRIH